MSINLAEQFEENEQYDKAYEEYKKVYSKKVTLDILERLGHVAIILDKKDEAQEYYEKILEIDKTNVMAYEQLMDIHVHSDRYKYYVARGNSHIVQNELNHAISDFKKALGKAQSEEEISATHFVLGSLYEQTGKYNQAIDEYLRILDSASGNEFVYLQLAKIYLAQDALNSAVEILERAKNSGYDTLNVRENLAQLYIRSGESSLAGEITQDNLVKIKCALDEDKNTDAKSLLESLTNEDKKNPQYHSLYAQYYFNTKDFTKALECVSNFDKVQPDSPLTYQMKALIYEELQDEFNSHINWAKYNIVRKDKDVALNEYFQAYQVKSDDKVVLKSIAELLEDLGDKHQAQEFWEKLVELDITDKKAIEKIADFKESIGDYREQVKYLEKLVMTDKRNLSAIKKMAYAYEKTKNKEKALEYFNKYISLAPVDEEYEKIKQKIAKLENTQMEEDEGLIGKIMKLFAK